LNDLNNLELFHTLKSLNCPLKMKKFRKYGKFNTHLHTGTGRECALSPLNNLNYFIFFYLYRYTKGLAVRDRSRKFKIVQKSGVVA
jgi:hypothetical protein